MSTRINARIDPQLSRQLDELRKLTGQTLTEIIEAALTAWTRKKLGKHRSPETVFTSYGFIGSGVGPRDLARNAKSHLLDSLKGKT